MVVGLTSVSLVCTIQLLQWRVRPAWASQLQKPQDTTQTSQSALFAKNKQRNCLWRSQLPTVRFWNSQETGQNMVMDTQHYPEISRRHGKLTGHDLESKDASWHRTCYQHSVGEGRAKRAVQLFRHIRYIN